jgi:serine/threonine-protein kinase
MTTLTGGREIRGKYRLDQKLATGGTSALWAAFDQTLERRVAIKFLDEKVRGNDSVLSRFAQEARLAARIASAHVIQTHDYGVHERVPFIVMELLDGEDLQQRLDRQVRLPVLSCVEILEQALRGLGAIHATGVIHRDLKPGNVFLARVAGAEVVKLFDFGVARSPRPRSVRFATLSGQFLGTPQYMSPEQVRCASRVDARSDLWSMGVMFHRALTGTHPFSGRSIPEIMESICHDAPPAPSSLHADLPAAADAFVARALARDPDQRFQSADQMLAALAAVRAEAQSAGRLSEDSLPTIDWKPSRVQTSAAPAYVPDANAAPSERVTIPVSWGSALRDAQRPAVADESTETPSSRSAARSRTALTAAFPLVRRKSAGAIGVRAAPRALQRWVAAIAVAVLLVTAGIGALARIVSKAVASGYPPARDAQGAVGLHDVP